MTIVNDTNEFTLDEVIKLVGSTVTVRPESEEIINIEGKGDIPFWKGEHPIRGFRFDEGVYQIEIPEKPIEDGVIDYHSKREFLEMFYI